MKVLVTGTQGQMARSLGERARRREDIELVVAGRPALDLTDPDSVVREIARLRPDVVISAAAYTAVDNAEDEPDLAFAINATGAEAVARGAAEVSAPVVHLSTDYVFSGDKADPYTEEDVPEPVSVYGRSKLLGEERVAQVNPKHLILRTGWMYSPFGWNFVRTMLATAARKDQIEVVADQTGNPTSALDIADAIFHLIAVLGTTPRWGVFHLAGQGSTNRSGFAEHIFNVSRNAGGPAARVVPVASAVFPTRARRPLNSRLSTGKFENVFGRTMPDWIASSTPVIHRLIESLNRNAQGR